MGPAGLVMSGLTGLPFEVMDSNGDGVIDRAEWERCAEEHQKAIKRPTRCALQLPHLRSFVLFSSFHFFRSTLYLAAAVGDLDLCRYLVGQGADANQASQPQVVF